MIGEEGEAHLRCNASGKPLDLSQAQGILAPIPGASEDGSSVYFASESALTGAEHNAARRKGPGGSAEPVRAPRRHEAGRGALPRTPRLGGAINRAGNSNSPNRLCQS